MEKNEKKKASVLLLEIKRSKQDKTYHVALKSEDKHQPQETQPTDKPQTWDFPWEKEDLLAQLYRARVLTRQEAENRGIDLDNFPQLYPRKARAVLKEMGDKFYDALFPPDSPTRQTLETRLQEAGKQGHILSLRLQLDPDDAELWAFPWELLYAHWIEASGEIQTTFTQTLNALAIIRYLPKKKAQPIFTRLQRIAFFAASPKDKTFPTHQTFEAIRSAWGVDRVSTSAGQSWEDWKTLMAQNPDVVHFLGHGDEQDRLAFIGEDNTEEPREAPQIANSLPTSLNLLTLQACSSGHLAARLIQKHPQLPLAVGMHYEIGIEVADAFAQGFYRTLLTSGRVEAAIAQARQHMLESSKDNQWLLPIQTMGVPEAYFSSKVFPKVSRRLPDLTHMVEREQLPALQERLFQHPLLALVGKPGSGRTWLALQALEKAGVEKKLLFDLSQGGDIYALWHALLNAFELPQAQHLYAPELTEERWQAMKKGLAQALQKAPHALLIKLPMQPPQDAQKEGWQYLFEALATKPPQAGQATSSHPPQTIFILDQEGKSAWLDLIGQDVPSLTLKLSEKEIVKLLQTYGFSIHEEENHEEIETMRMRLSDETLWQLRQWLENQWLEDYEGPKDLDQLLEILEREGFSLKGRWEKFSPLEQEILKWAAIADAPLAPTDLLSLLNRTGLALDKVEESLDALTQAKWLRPEESGYRLVPAARPFVREQMERRKRRQGLKRWHRHQALVEQAAKVETLLDDDDLEKAANLLLSETWHPWQISPSYRYKLLEFAEDLWEERDALPAELLFKLAMRAALAARALGDYQVASTWYERANKVASTPEEHLQALIEMAWMRHRIGSSNWEEIAEDIEALLKEVQAPQLHAQWFFALGTIYGERFEYPQAIEAVEQGLNALGISNLDPAQAVETFPDIRHALKQWVLHGSSPLLAAQAMRAYGVALLHSQAVKPALQAFQASLKFYEQVEDRYMEGITHNNIAAAYTQLGDHPRAQQHLQQAQAILREIGDPAFGHLITLFNQAIISLSRPTSFQEVLNILQQAQRIIDAYGYESHRINVLMEMGRAHMMLGQWEQAREAWAKAGNYARTRLDDSLLHAWSLCLQVEANLYHLEYSLCTGRSSSGIIAQMSKFKEELEKPSFSYQDDPELFISAYLFFALDAILKNQPEEAERWLQQQPLPLGENEDYGIDTRLKWHDVRGMLFTLKGEPQRAYDEFAAGLDLTDALAAYRTQLRYHYAQALLEGQDIDQAQEQIEQALEEAEQMEIPWLQEMIQALQAQIADPAS